MTSLILKNGTIVTAQGMTRADVFLKDGKIADIDRSISVEGAQVIDCTGLHVLPGVIDMHVHFRDPGGTHKEDFLTGSAAAASGGVTTVIDMPNTSPLVTTMEALDQKRKIVQGRSYVNYGFYFGGTEDNLDEAAQALKAGVFGIKIYMGKSTGNLLVESTEMLEKFLELGGMCIIHAEDQNMIGDYEEKFLGAVEPRTHSLIRNPLAAAAATERIIELSKKTNGRIHITHLSTGLEIEELRKNKTALITADATPHHLFLTDDDYQTLGNRAKVNPPLRFEEDREALWSGINEGLIDCVATDHAPHTLEEKDREYKNVPSGMPGVEMSVPLLLDAVNRDKISLQQFIALTSTHPAEILGLKTKGKIEMEFDADLTIVDMNEERAVGEKKYFTKCNWSPYEGRKLKGWPKMTIVGGKVVFQDGLLMGEPTGKELLKN